jgi:hypothetical protein
VRPASTPVGDPDTGALAQTALGSLVRDWDPRGLLLLRLHEFLWHELPTRWPGTTDHHLAIAGALAELFEGAEMAHHSAVCSSPLTSQIINTYLAAGPEQGFIAFRQALAETGLEPPDTRILRWSQTKGPREQDAYRACARDIEDAITAGTLHAGAGNWRAVRMQITEQRLRDGWLGAVHSERRYQWVQAAPGALDALRREVSLQLVRPLPPPESGYPALRWLLERAAYATQLTDGAALPPRLVAEAVDRFGWRDQLTGVLNREADVPPLRRLRELAQGDMRAVAMGGSALALTSVGKRMLADEQFLHTQAAAALIGDDHGLPDLGTAIREAALTTLLLATSPTDHERLLAAIVPIAGTLGMPVAVRDVRLDEAVRHAVSDLFHRLWALQLLHPTEGWAGRVSLGERGKSAARTALRARAIAPATSEFRAATPPLP